LRANGSRECAPDDRLREAIQQYRSEKTGLLRRFTPRNDVGRDRILEIEGPGFAGAFLIRHARPCAGHPRLYGWKTNKTWMAGTSPAMTRE
jgi:hypothetical protein